MKEITSFKTSWDLSPLFKSDNDPNIEVERKKCEKVVDGFVKKWKENKRYLTDPKKLREALDDYELWMRNYGANSRESFYFFLRNSDNQLDGKVKAKMQKADDLMVELINKMNFFILDIGKIDLKNQNVFLKNKELQKYRHFLEMIFREAKYYLSEAQEKIDNLKSQTAYSNWKNMRSSFISKEQRNCIGEDGKKKIRGFEELLALVSSKSKKVRNEAAKNVNDILEKNSDVAEWEINSILQDLKVEDELRGRDRPDLARHISDDIESEVVDVLIETIERRFDISKRFYKLKAKLLGVKKLKYHERNVPIGELDKKYSISEAIELNYKVLNGLDKQFGSIFKDFVENGRIDFLPKKGKRGGAYCSDNGINLPTFISMNFTGRLNDVTTMAHEIGHAINDKFMKMAKKTNALHYGISMAVAEVASTFMEDFIFHRLLSGINDEGRFSLLMTRLNDDVSTIQRQTACYILEKDLHMQYRKTGYLTKKDIGRIFQKNMKAYMGSFVEQLSGSQNWWVYWSHIRYYFYVYSYVSGILISKSLQNRVKKDPNEIEKVKYFLSAGNSDSPKNIFKTIGIDITKKEFWNEGLDEMENLLEETEKLARKLSKIK
ncbi:MAG TPA: M3 family oligoendopeptidase [Patescibacteria group bacterium]|nr:M3 family oligoendopeptidase [Patescibacteria group bacterium]